MAVKGKFIPVEKMTKKQRKAYYAKQRLTWEGFDPVTRTVPNGRGYDRNKQRQEDRRSGRMSRGYSSAHVFC